MSEKLSEKEIEEFKGNNSEVYPVMPLRNTVLFPQQVIPIYIGRDRSLKLINDLPSDSKYIVVVAQEDGSVEDPKPIFIHTALSLKYLKFSICQTIANPP